MSIIRAERKVTYTNIDNRIIEDSMLDWKDLGLLVYLLSKPDYWTVSAEHLANQRKLGRDGIYSGLKAICEAGYADKKPNPKGGWDWYISETPLEHRIERENIKTKSNSGKKSPVWQQEKQNRNTENPDTENPDTENRNRENPVLVNTDISTTTEKAVNTEKAVKRAEAPLEVQNLEKAETEKVVIEQPAKESIARFDYREFNLAFALAYLISENRVNRNSSIEGISMKLWREWMESRKAGKKAKMTEKALTTCLKDLIEIQNAGLDANTAMQEAIDRDWIGLGHWIEKMKPKAAFKTKPDFHNPPKYELSEKTRNSELNNANVIDSTSTTLFGGFLGAR